MEEDQVLDLFDEAIRVTQELSGEETDTVGPEGFARVVREHNLFSLQSVCAMVDAVAFGRSESGRKPSMSSWASARERLGGGGDEGGEKSVGRNSFTRRSFARTMIRTASSKANDRDSRNSNTRASFSTQKADSVHSVIRTAVQSHFLFRQGAPKGPPAVLF